MMRTSMLILSVLTLSLSASAAQLVAQLPDEMMVVSTAIQGGDISASCQSKSADVDKLVANVVANRPDLAGLISQRSVVDRSTRRNDCYYQGTVNILCSADYTVDGCFTSVSMTSDNYKLVFETNGKPDSKDLVYDEMDHGVRTSLSLIAN